MVGPIDVFGPGQGVGGPHLCVTTQTQRYLIVVPQHGDAVARCGGLQCDEFGLALGGQFGGQVLIGGWWFGRGFTAQRFKRRGPRRLVNLDRHVEQIDRGGQCQRHAASFKHVAGMIPVGDLE